MAHDITIIISKANAMKGNGTTGSLNSLVAVCTAADDVLNNGEPTNATEIHEKLEEIQSWLVSAEPCVSDFETELEGMIS